MTDTVRNIFAGVALGFRDAILGTLRVYTMDSEAQGVDSGQQQKSQMTTLARRRAGRMKHKEVKKESEPRVLQRIFLCCAWNGGLFLLSILVFNQIILPCLYWLTQIIIGGAGTHNVVWGWIGPMLSWTFSALWILPLFVLSKIVNCFWFQDIADAAYRKARGKPQLQKISLFIADILFSIVLQSLFLIQGTLAAFLPLPGIGQFVALIHMCMLYSLYAFEYKWFNMGWEVHKRLTYIESNWPYFCGFGLPLALFTSLPSSLIISGCLFSILFPLFIISANEAEEQLQPFEFPLKLFAPVVSLSNAIFHHSVRRRPLAPAAAPAAPPSSSPVRKAHFQQR